MEYNPQTTTITNRLKRTLVLEAGDTLYLQRLAGRGYQLTNLRRFRDLTPNARTIIDIGANIGNNTIEYATWAKQVKSFEPTPWTREWLVANVEYNKTVYVKNDGWYKIGKNEWASLERVGDIEIFPYALSDHEYTTEMLSHPRNAGHNHLITEGTKKLTKRGWVDINPNKQSTYLKYSVEVRTLDSFNFTEVDGIKIDVEGWELPIIRGARTIIDRDRPVIQTEIVEKQCLRAGYTAQELCDYMYNIGYIQTLNDGTELTRLWEQVPRKMDRFWVPRERV